MRKRELAKLDENRRAEGMLNAILSIQVKTIKLKAATLAVEGNTPMTPIMISIISIISYEYDHGLGLSRRSSKVKPPMRWFMLERASK